jgi:hypothetical protein
VVFDSVEGAIRCGLALVGVTGPRLLVHSL